MSFDLAVWEGERPADDASALHVYESLIERWHGPDLLEKLEARIRGEQTDHDPTAAIVQYVAGLLDRWPDITTDDGEESPWSDGPLIYNATGPLIYFGLRWSMADEAAPFAADLATQLGLVCFDPQAQVLR